MLKHCALDSYSGGLTMAESSPKSGPPFDIAEFELLDKYIPDGCPICKNLNWNVWQADNGVVSTVLWGKETGDALLRAGVPVLTFSCTNCGFVRQYQVDAFRTFLEKLKNERSESD
jgi:hypothetical protein